MLCCCCCAGDRPYLISGADDKLAKVWDYQTKACVQTLEGHGHNVSAVLFHPELPIIVTGSEDGSVKFWHSTTYRLESTLNYGLERLWALGACKGSNQCAPLKSTCATCTISTCTISACTICACTISHEPSPQQQASVTPWMIICC